MDRRSIFLNNDDYEMHNQNEAESHFSQDKTGQNGNQYVI